MDKGENQQISVYLACADKTTDEWFPVGVLSYKNSYFDFYYVQGAMTNPKIFTYFSNMSKLNMLYRSEEMFPVFQNRLLSGRYSSLLKWLDLDEYDKETKEENKLKMEILSLTEGRRKTDSIFTFPFPLRDDRGKYVARFFIHDLDITLVDRITVGDKLALCRSDKKEAFFFD